MALAGNALLVGGAGSERDVQALTDALGELLVDADSRSDLGEKARVRAREFSWEQTADGVRSVLVASMTGTHMSGLVASSPDRAGYRPQQPAHQ